MVIIDYSKEHAREIIISCAHALKKGKVIAYATDTSYGLAVDATNVSAVKKLYRVKGRKFNKPVHIIPPSLEYTKKIVQWNTDALRLAKKYWPGPLTLVLGLRAKGLGYRMLSAKSGFLGIRMPNNKAALALAKHLQKPITATSANISGKNDCYSAADVIAQFKKSKFKPDIIIDAGKLTRRKPSTVVKIENHRISILRPGQITQKQINPRTFRSIVKSKQKN